MARFGAIVTGALILCAGATANATIIMDTLPEFSFGGGPTFPTAAQNMGTFNYVIPAGEEIVSAMLNGTFGNSVATSSAPHRVFGDGSLVAACGGPPCTSAGLVPWTFNFSDFSNLQDGSLVMTTIQDSPAFIREGNMKLTIETQPVLASEPGTLTLFGLGLAGLGYMRRRRAA